MRRPRIALSPFSLGYLTGWLVTIICIHLFEVSQETTHLIEKEARYFSGYADGLTGTRKLAANGLYGKVNPMHLPELPGTVLVHGHPEGESCSPIRCAYVPNRWTRWRWRLGSLRYALILSAIIAIPNLTILIFHWHW